MPEITLYWVCWSKNEDHAIAKEGPFIDIDQASFRADELNKEETKDRGYRCNYHDVYKSTLDVEPI